MDGQNAVDVLSRGQMKLVVCALKIAQAMLLEESGRLAAISLQWPARASSIELSTTSNT